MPRLRVAVPPNALSALCDVVPASCELVPTPGRQDDIRADLAKVEFLVLEHDRDDIVRALRDLPALRVVQLLIAGSEWVGPFVPHAVRLCRAVGTRDIAVAEWVACALLGMASGLLPAAREQHARAWVRSASGELCGQRVIVVGQGGAGRATARLLSSLGVDVVRVAARERAGVYGCADLPTLLPDAQAVVLLVPGGASTLKMVDARFLDLLPTGAVLVNAARGSVVDTTALLDELQTGRLRAVLDVVDPEPLPDDHPLWKAPGCIISPHVAGATEPARARALEFVAAQLHRYAGDLPLLGELPAAAV